ncbi:MAG: hypothetical protein AAFN11_02335 [Chloroflexota bacterium]
MTDKKVTDKTNVAVSQYKKTDAILMDWQSSANKHEIKAAYEAITELLDATESPTYVVVDLRKNRYMPFAPTLKGALFGPHRHNKLMAWLVIGENAFASSVAEMLDRLTNMEKILWFKDESEVDTFLYENKK